MNFDLNHYQADFLLSTARYPCLITGVGTGKTFIALNKVVKHCQDNTGARVMVVRKELTDLRDSTMKDFTEYFGFKTDVKNNYKFPNGSEIMFRHGNMNDLAVLKNVNLTMAFIEQAEEYENDDVFNFLRDRLRNPNAKLRQLIMIANSNGMNWLWSMFVSEAEKVVDYNTKVKVLDGMYDTGETYYFKEDNVKGRTQQYECWTANSMVNAHNLPEDTIIDWFSMEENAPNHFKKMIMNSFEDIDADDTLLTSDDINQALTAEFLFNKDIYTAKIMAVDIARFGNDSNDAVLLEQRGPMHWEETIWESWKGVDLMVTTGRVVDLIVRLRPDVVVIDEEGMGAGVVDRLRELNIGITVVGYRGGMTDKLKHKSRYVDHNAEHAFFMKEQLIQGGRLKMRPEVRAEAQTVRYKFMSNGKKRMVSKDEMRAKSIKSPNHFDALKMACSEVDTNHVDTYKSKRKQPKYAQSYQTGR